jgi:hypothetical protein
VLCGGLLAPFFFFFQEMGQKASNNFKAYFAEDVYFNYVIDNCLDIMKKQLISEVIYWKLNPLIIFTKKLKHIGLMRT